MQFCCCRRRRTAKAREGAMCSVNNREGGRWPTLVEPGSTIFRREPLQNGTTRNCGDGTDQFRVQTAQRVIFRSGQKRGDANVSGRRRFIEGLSLGQKI
jgi:hypothetical protein